MLEAGTAPAQRALLLSPRDPLAAVYRGTASYAQFVGHNYDEAMRLAREGVRQRADLVGAHRVLTAAAGMADRSHRRCQGRVAGAAARTAQYFARLDRRAMPIQTRGRAEALSGRISPRRYGLMPRSLDYRSIRGVGAPTHLSAAVWTQIAIAHIVCENENDVGLLLLCGCSR